MRYNIILQSEKNPSSQPGDFCALYKIVLYWALKLKYITKINDEAIVIVLIVLSGSNLLLLCSGHLVYSELPPNLPNKKQGNYLRAVGNVVGPWDDSRVPNTVPIYTVFQSMMTSSNGNIFRITGPLCGEFTGPGEFPARRPMTRSFDVFFDLRPNKRLSKQPWGWWFETPSWSSLRHCNEYNDSYDKDKTVSWTSYISGWNSYNCTTEASYSSDLRWRVTVVSLEMWPGNIRLISTYMKHINVCFCEIIQYIIPSLSYILIQIGYVERMDCSWNRHRHSDALC